MRWVNSRRGRARWPAVCAGAPVRGRPGAPVPRTSPTSRARRCRPGGRRFGEGGQCRGEARRCGHRDQDRGPCSAPVLRGGQLHSRNSVVRMYRPISTLSSDLSAARRPVVEGSKKGRGGSKGPGGPSVARWGVKSPVTPGVPSSAAPGPFLRPAVCPSLCIFTRYDLICGSPARRDRSRPPRAPNPANGDRPAAVVMLRRLGADGIAGRIGLVSPTPSPSRRGPTPAADTPSTCGFTGATPRRVRSGRPAARGSCPPGSR
jgi:hypothetical protein